MTTIPAEAQAEFRLAERNVPAHPLDYSWGLAKFALVLGGSGMALMTAKAAAVLSLA